jgi:DNA-directed RNA polymerase specialized sigma subunit
MLELRTVKVAETKGWTLKIHPVPKKNELVEEDWKRILRFTGGIVAKMKYLLPWNVRSPMEFEDWIQIGCIAICKMHLREDCPPFGTSGYWKLAATYIRQEIRNEIQKLTTQGRNINAVDNEIEVDSCTWSSSASDFPPDKAIREKELYTIVRKAAKELSDKHSQLLEYLIPDTDVSKIGALTRSEFLYLCKRLKVEPRVLNTMWRELKEKCYEAVGE